MLTSEWRDYPPLQKATCLFNAVFTCLKVNVIKSVSLPASPPGSSPSGSHRGQGKPRSPVVFPAGNAGLKPQQDWEFDLILCEVPSSSASPSQPIAGRAGRSWGEYGAEGAAAISATDLTKKKSSTNMRRLCPVPRSGSENQPLQKRDAVPSLSSVPSSVPIPAVLAGSGPRPGRRGMGASQEKISQQSGAAAAVFHTFSSRKQRDWRETENPSAGPSCRCHLPRRIPPSCRTTLPPAQLAPSMKPLKLFDQLRWFF